MTSARHKSAGGRPGTQITVPVFNLRSTGIISPKLQLSTCVQLLLMSKSPLSTRVQLLLKSKCSLSTRVQLHLRVQLAFNCWTRVEQELKAYFNSWNSTIPTEVAVAFFVFVNSYHNAKQNYRNAKRNYCYFLFYLVNLTTVTMFFSLKRA